MGLNMLKKLSFEVRAFEQYFVKSLLTGVLLLATTSLQAGMLVLATSVDGSAEVKLALGIVRKYRELRAAGRLPSPAR